MSSSQPVYYPNVVEAHGILGSLAWVIFVPTAAILLRLLPGQTGFWAHVSINLLAVALIISNAGMGIWMALMNGELGGSVYHPIIGLVVFCVVALQPIWGWTQHALDDRKGRTFWGHVHIWLGRMLITLGMINGGFGLLLSSNATRGENIAYGVVAGTIWVVYIAVAVQNEVRAARSPSPTPYGARSAATSSSVRGDEENKDGSK